MHIPKAATSVTFRITQFNEQTTDGLKQAINELNAQLGADKIKEYVVDLRNNPGGLLDQAISVSETFLEKGEIVSTRGPSGASSRRGMRHLTGAVWAKLKPRTDAFRLLGGTSDFPIRTNRRSGVHVQINQMCSLFMVRKIPITFVTTITKVASGISIQ